MVRVKILTAAAALAWALAVGAVIYYYGYDAQTATTIFVVWQLVYALALGYFCGAYVESERTARAIEDQIENEKRIERYKRDTKRAMFEQFKRTDWWN